MYFLKQNPAIGAIAPKPLHIGCEMLKQYRKKQKGPVKKRAPKKKKR